MEAKDVLKEGKGVMFDHRVKGRRGVDGGSAGGTTGEAGSVQTFKEFSTSLTSDRKRTAGSFKSRNVRSRRSSLEGDDIREEEEEKVAEEVLKADHVPVPL